MLYPLIWSPHRVKYTFIGGKTDLSFTSKRTSIANNAADKGKMHKIIALIEEWRIYLRCILRGKCHPEMCAWLAYRHLTCLEIESDLAFFCPSIALVWIFNIFSQELKILRNWTLARCPPRWCECTVWAGRMYFQGILSVNLRWASWCVFFSGWEEIYQTCRRCASEKSSAVLTCSYAPDVSFLSHSKLCLLERTLWNSIALWRRDSV